MTFFQSAATHEHAWESVGQRQRPSLEVSIGITEGIYSVSNWKYYVLSITNWVLYFEPSEVVLSERIDFSINFLIFHVLRIDDCAVQHFQTWTIQKTDLKTTIMQLELPAKLYFILFEAVLQRSTDKLDLNGPSDCHQEDATETGCPFRGSCMSWK